MSDGEPQFFNDNKTHKLVLGASFKKNTHTAFHTVRYDFKPASVDQQREGELEVGATNEVTVSLPHVQGSKTSRTVYKGSKKPAQKECVLVYDHVTGEFTLERITSQIQVKKTRDAGNHNFPSHPTLVTTAPKLPKVLMSKKQMKSGNGTGNGTNNRSLNRRNEVSQKKNDDNTTSHPSNDGTGNVNRSKLPKATPEKPDPPPQNTKAGNVAGSAISSEESHSSSSSSSSSTSDDDSASSSDENEASLLPVAKPSIVFDSQLHEDLELSESGSDSD